MSIFFFTYTREAAAIVFLFMPYRKQETFFFFFALLAPGALPAVGVLVALGSLGLEDL